MTLKTYLFSMLIINFILIACGNKNKIEKEYFSNGEWKETVMRSDSVEMFDVKIYYPNGRIKKSWTIINEMPNGIFESYDIGGQITSKGYFKNGIAIGPTYYFYNNNLVLYNERDAKGDIYYVKKFDSLTHELVVEEGVCFSPNYEIEKQNDKLGEARKLLLFYAQPDNYSNNISVFLNHIPVRFEMMEGHVCKVQLPNEPKVQQTIKIYSILKKSDSSIVCTDSFFYDLNSVM